MTDTYQPTDEADVFDPGNFLAQERRNATVVAMQGLNEDPEKAARALQLSRATGAGPNLVYGDLENFETQTKSALAANLLRDNEYLRQFVNTYPLAAKLSNDDYGNLDETSQSVTKLYGDLPHFPSLGILGRAIQGFASGVKEGFGENKPFTWVKEEPIRQALQAATPQGMLNTPIFAPEFILRGMSALIKGVAEGASAAGEEAYIGATGDASGARRFGRDLAAMVEWGTTAPPHMRPAVTPEVLARVRQTAEKVRPWLDQGLEPPLGIDRTIDEIKINQSQVDLDNLAQAEKNAQKSALKERAPEAFAEFIRNHTNAQIGISPDAVRKLYGEELPVWLDGKLGFVPRLADQLQLAELSGADILIPVADWLAHVDPAIAKELRDDIRVRPGGVTKNEAVKVKEQADIEPQPPTDAIAAVREQAGLKPVTDIDARKLTLQRTNVRAVEGDYAHPFAIMDQQGNRIGELHVAEENGGKRLYIDDIRGDFGEASINALGPAAIRDLLRQLKAEFPAAEELTGMRVSGARDKAGTWEEKGKVTIKLSDATLDEMAEFAKSIVPVLKEDIGAGVELSFKPAEAYTAHEKLIVERVQETLARIVPELQDVRTVQKVEMGGKEVGGVYVAPDNALPIVAVSLNVRDAGKTARHEAIHFLKDYGFFTPDEWAALEKAAEGWLAKHNIAERYKKYENNKASLIEEAIAEEFGEWGSATEAPRKHYEKAVQNAFEKLAAFFKEVLEAMKEIFGHAPKIDELFEKIESGEVGRRAMGEGQGVAKEGKASQGELDVTRMEDKDLFERAAAIGMTEPQLARYMKLIEKQRSEDLAAATKKAVEIEKRKQTQTWKDNERGVREEVVRDFQTRPDVQVDQYFRTGTLYGEEGAKPKLAWDALTAEERAALPKNFVAERGKGGMLPDDLAPLFGYTSGGEMLDHLIAFTDARKASGMQPLAFSRRLVDAEVERVMAERYGDLNENILEAVKDQVFSETQLDLLHEETVAAAMKAGVELSIPKNVIRDEIIGQVNASNLSTLKLRDYETAAGRAGREFEMALLKGDAAEAFRQKQRQYMAVIAAKEVMEVQKEVAQFEKKVKGYRGRSGPDSVDPSFSTYIQSLLSEANIRVGQSADELATGREFYMGPLDNFVTERASYGDELAVPLGYAAKPVEDMTVAEFREFKAAIDSMDKAGRDLKKVTVGENRMEMAEFEKEVIANLEQRPAREIKRDSTGAEKRSWNWFYGFDAWMTRPEEIIHAMDMRKELGPLFEALITTYSRSKADTFTMREALTKELNKIDYGREWRKSLADELPGNFVFDTYDGTVMKLNRLNMIRMMFNMGTEENFNKLAYGIAAAREGGKVERDVVASQRAEIERFVQTHATKQDWEFVQKVFDIFEGWKGKADTLYRNLSGVAPKWIPSRPIDTPHGQFAGGYFPLIPDRNRPLPGHRALEETGSRPQPKGPLPVDNYYRATTHTPFYKERTGAQYFVDINGSIDSVAGRMQQMIHDLGYRDFVINAGKVLYNPRIMQAMRKHYGPEHTAQLKTWLERVANEFTVNEAEAQTWNNTLRQVRFNLIAHALPLNYRVMLSPSLGTGTALKFWSEFYRNHEANMQVVKDNSQELNHLLFNLDRDISDTFGRITSGRSLTSYQKKGVEWMLSGLTWLEQQTRSATFYEEFNRQLGKGMDNRQAADIADSIVRQRHGSFTPGDLSAMMSSKSEFIRFSTIFMGYFQTVYNWSRTMPDQVRMGDFKGLSKTLWGTLGIGFLMQAALFERQKKDDTLGSYLGRSFISTPLSSIPFMREGYQYATEGHKPTSPIFSMFVSLGKLGKDGWDAFQGKKIKRPVRDIANVLGQGFGVPGMLQIGRTTGFAYDVARGEQRPRDIVEWGRGILSGEARLRK